VRNLFKSAQPMGGTQTGQDQAGSRRPEQQALPFGKGKQLLDVIPAPFESEENINKLRNAESEARPSITAFTAHPAKESTHCAISLADNLKLPSRTYLRHSDERPHSQSVKSSKRTKELLRVTDLSRAIWVIAQVYERIWGGFGRTVARYCGRMPRTGFPRGLTIGPSAVKTRARLGARIELENPDRALAECMSRAPHSGLSGKPSKPPTIAATAVQNLETDPGCIYNQA